MRIAIAAAAVTLSTVGFATTGTVVAADGADAPADKSTALAEIIVTAEKREERLQDTPISMTVINTTAITTQSKRFLAMSFIELYCFNFVCRSPARRPPGCVPGKLSVCAC